MNKNALLCSMIQTQIVIIGGGAAGLFAAAVAAEKGLAVTILEKNGRCGRKIALTGKGRCNLTNTKPWSEFSQHIHPSNLFFKNAFYNMSNVKTMAFFEKIGLPLVEERGARVFPASMRAQDVTDTLVRYLKSKRVEIITNCEVQRIESVQNENKGHLFTIFSGNTPVVTAPTLMLATGGLSYPSTGSTGDGYHFAKAFGHTITDCFPSLTALVPKNYSQQYHGISLKNVEVTLCINKSAALTEFGDIDFTNGGIEGPIGFKISRKAVYNLKNGQKVEVLLDLKPAVSLKQLTDRVAREIALLSPGQQRELERNGAGCIAKYLLPKFMPKVLIIPFFNANKDISIHNLPVKLKEWRFEIASYVGYERCVITAGGVSLAEVSQKTMESKLVEGLYFAGEILDIDGDTGGYNLQIAFSTAALAVESIDKKLHLPASKD